VRSEDFHVNENLPSGVSNLDGSGELGMREKTNHPITPDA
jgi:hypothetical protein